MGISQHSLSSVIGSPAVSITNQEWKEVSRDYFNNLSGSAICLIYELLETAPEELDDSVEHLQVVAAKGSNSYFWVHWRHRNKENKEEVIGVEKVKDLLRPALLTFAVTPCSDLSRMNVKVNAESVEKLEGSNMLLLRTFVMMVTYYPHAFRCFENAPSLLAGIGLPVTTALALNAFALKNWIFFSVAETRHMGGLPSVQVIFFVLT